MFTRVQFKEEAKEKLRGNWSYMAGLAVIMMILSGIAGWLLGWIPLIGTILTLFISVPFQLSTIIIAIKLYHKVDIPVNDVFIGFKFTMKAVGLTLWMDLWIFLWSLLFIIPGIIKSYSYSMAYFCLVHNPELSIRDALNESKRITDGYKMDLFIMDLSFLGWIILCFFSCFIGFIFLSPYQIQTKYIAYRFIKMQHDDNLDEHESLHEESPNE